MSFFSVCLSLALARDEVEETNKYLNNTDLSASVTGGEMPRGRPVRIPIRGAPKRRFIYL